MRFWNIYFLLIVLCVCGADVAGARTWHIELDGSGDFADIQPAVDAAAAGDTIRIGPGRFDTFHPCVAPAWTEDAIVSVTKDNLTFIGAGKGVTILGTSEYSGTPTTDSKVFCSIEPFDGLIREMTIENVENGIYWWHGSVTVVSCLFHGLHEDFIGMFGALDGGKVEDCEFILGALGSGVILHNTVQGFEIRDSTFQGLGFAVNVINGSRDVAINGCVFEDSYIAILFGTQSAGSINNCQLNAIATEGISIATDCHVICDRVSIDGAAIGIGVSGSSSLVGTDLIIENTTSSGVRMFTRGVVTINNSHILPASGLGINCLEYPGDQVVLDLTQNYWGTANPDSIAAMINDVNDDPNIHYTINFQPFAGGPVPTEAMSWGTVKALFRGGAE